MEEVQFFHVFWRCFQAVAAAGPRRSGFVLTARSSLMGFAGHVFGFWGAAFWRWGGG